MSQEVKEIPTNLSFIDVIRFPSRFPNIFGYYKATLQQVLDKYLQDNNRAKAVQALVSAIVAYKLEERVYQSLQINVILPLTEPFTSNS